MGIKSVLATVREKIRVRPWLTKSWRIVKRIFLVLFLAQLFYIILLRWMPVYTTPYIIQNWFDRIGTDKKLYKDWVPFEDISDNMKLAVIASEDQLFSEHFGFDLEAIGEAMRYNQKHTKRTHGASTISQQTAKNVFLWQGRNYIRKGLEVYFTFMIELIWGKDRILEVYLNVAQTGDGYFGVETAARQYFGKHAKDLTREEAALIAATLPNPVVLKAAAPSQYLLKRQRWVLRQMKYMKLE